MLFQTRRDVLMRLWGCAWCAASQWELLACVIAVLTRHHPACSCHISGGLQVLSVPFYSWDQAQSLQQRAAYLDCLLGSQSSHLATSQVQILPSGRFYVVKPPQFSSSSAVISRLISGSVNMPCIMQAVGLEPLYRVPGVRVMPPLMPKPPSMLGGAGSGVGPPVQRGLGAMMRPMGSGGGAGFGPSGSQHLMPGVGHLGMGGLGAKLGMPYGGPLPGHLGGVGGSGHYHPHGGHGPGHGMPDPYGGQGAAPAASPFAARHQQLASPAGGSDYGGVYGSRCGSDVGASPGPRPGSETHTPSRGPPSDQARLRHGRTTTRGPRSGSGTA